jgi:hypothetical protein
MRNVHRKASEKSLQSIHKIARFREISTKRLEKQMNAVSGLLETSEQPLFKSIRRQLIGTELQIGAK